jgi:hypothetical protein
MNLSPDQARRLALANGAARCALGIVAFVLPAVPLGPWIGDGRHDPSARLLARALGGRDFAIGLGTIMALRHGGPVRGWVEAGGLADAGDVAVTALSFTKLPRRGRWGVLVAAGGGVLAARLAAPAVDADRSL